MEQWEYRIYPTGSPGFYLKPTDTFTIERVTTPSLPDSTYEIVKGNDNSYGTISYGYYVRYYSLRNTVLTFYKDENLETKLFHTDSIRPRTGVAGNGNPTLPHELPDIKITSIDNNFLSLINSTTQTIFGNSSGTTSSSNSLLLYSKNYFTVKINVQAKASVSDIADYTSSVYFGLKASVTLDQSAGNNVKFDVEWKIGQTVISKQTITTGNKAEYTISTSYKPSTGTYSTGVVVVYTYYNNILIGERQRNITYNVKEIGAPTITRVQVDHFKDNGKNAFIQKLTGAKITVSSSSADSSVSISKYTLVTPHITLTQTTNVFEISTLQAGGDYPYTVTVTDSNGKQSAPYTSSIPVISYSPPSLSAVSAGRYSINSQGQYVPDENGKYGLLKATLHYSQIRYNSSTNTARLSYQLKTESSSYDSSVYPNASSSSDGTSAYNNIVVSSTLSDALDTIYTLKVMASDLLGGSAAPVEIVLSAASYSIHVRNGDQPDGTGVAVGTVSTKGKVFEVAESWKPMWGNYQIPRIKFTEQPPGSNQSNIEGLLWLSPGSSGGSNNIVYSETRPDSANEGTVWLQPLPSTVMIPIIPNDSSSSTLNALRSYFNDLPIILLSGVG